MAHKAGFVNIIGNPNVGKSTLMNALVGERLSIISSKAQTTRHRIMGIVNGEDFQIVYSDTPGVLKPNYKLQESMMEFVHSAIVDADVMLFVTDIYEDIKIDEKILDRIKKTTAPVLLLVNKIDLASQEKLEEKVQYWKTEMPNAEVIFGIIMGTGVGGGIVVNHKVINGRHGLGGEWGHNFLDESGGMCYCGRVGCVETMISGPALERFYLKQSGNALKLKEIVSNYETGNDSAAELTMKQLVTYFGKAVGPIINIIDPEAIVIGGGVGNIDILYTEGVEEVKKYVFNSRLDTMFLKPTLGDSAGVFGAAIL
jgi:small GTP-binding protein